MKITPPFQLRTLHTLYKPFGGVICLRPAPVHLLPCTLCPLATPPPSHNNSSLRGVRRIALFGRNVALWHQPGSAIPSRQLPHPRCCTAVSTPRNSSLAIIFKIETHVFVRHIQVMPVKHLLKRCLSGGHAARQLFVLLCFVSTFFQVSLHRS